MKPSREIMRAMVAAIAVLSGCAPLVQLPAGVSPVANGVVGPAPGSLVGPPAPVHANPMFVAAGDREYAWQQIIDVVDDYFRITREERVKQAGDVLTPGRIDTLPQGGATLLEPHRRDAANRYERIEGTLQTVRRTGTVYVTPASGGYLIEVVVLKEKEDLPRPERSTASAATLRHDQTLRRSRVVRADEDAPRVWYPVGRDAALEQTILAQLGARLGTAHVIPGGIGPPPLGSPAPLPATNPGGVPATP